MLTEKWFEALGVEPPAKNMSVCEEMEYMIEHGCNQYDVAYSYYKLLGFSDRVAGEKAFHVCEGGYL